MRAILASALTAFLLLAPLPASATTINMKTFKCEAFAGLLEEEKFAVMAWIAGFESDDDEELVLDTEEIEDDTETLAEYCAKNPAVTLLDAADKAFD